jgi:tripartite-type tricarboxylate transporter receptor subunit TctC
MNRRRLLQFGGLAAAAVHGFGFATQPYPSKPIRLVVGLAPGGIADQVGRLMAIHLAEVLGHPVVVENQSGAGGALAARTVKAAAPDGYTLGIAFDGTFAAGVAALPNIGFDPVRDFAVISKLVDSPVMITAYNGFLDPANPAKDFGEVIRIAQHAISSKKGFDSVLDYGTAGVGSTGHLAMELIKVRTGMRAVHIPFRGGGDVRMSVLGKQIPLMLAAVPATIADIRAGNLKGLAVTSAKRCPAAPGVPALSELGFTELADIDMNSWVGLVAPKQTPKDIVERLNGAVREALAQPALRKTLLDIGTVPVGNLPEQFAGQITADVDRWRKVIKSSNLMLEA